MIFFLQVNVSKYSYVRVHLLALQNVKQLGCSKVAPSQLNIQIVGKLLNKYFEKIKKVVKKWVKTVRKKFEVRKFFVGTNLT